MFLRPLQIRVGYSLPFGHHNKTMQETKKSVRIGLRAEYWLMFCLYLTGMLYRSPNTSWTPSVRPTVWTCPGRPSGTILMASSTNASFLSHNSWPQSSVPTRKYNTPTSRPPVPVTVAVLSRLIDSECLASVFSRVNAAITLYLSDFTDKRMTSTTAAWVTTSGPNTDVPPPTSSEERWTWSAQKSSVCSLDPSTCPLPVAANCAMSARTWSPTPGSTSTYPPPRSKTRIPPHCDNWRHDEDNWMTSLPASCLHCVVCPTIVESSPKCHIFF